MFYCIALVRGPGLTSFSQHSVTVVLFSSYTYVICDCAQMTVQVSEDFVANLG